MKYIFITIITICTFVNGFSQGGLILEKVVAKVGSEEIFYSDVQELLGYAKAQNPEYDETLQCNILDQLISGKLLVDQAKIDSIYITDVELDAQVQRRLDYILAQMNNDEGRFFEYYKKSVAQQRELMREPMREQMIQERIQGSLIQSVEITPSEVISFFESIPTDSLPFLPAEVELGEISLKTMISDEVKNAAREKLAKVRSRIIDDGESFAELASLFSDDPGSGANGGELGWAKRGSYVPEFEAMAYSLEPGEISEIVETQFGFHILELLERRGNTIKLRHILIIPDKTEEDIQTTKDLLDSVKTLIVQDSLPFEYAVNRFSDDEAQSYNNAGRLLNPETGDTFWETGQLPYQLYFAIDGLEEGDLSEIVEVEERGEKVYKLLQLQTKTRPHRASLDTDFNRIKQFAQESKKNEYFENWMLNKVDNTLIEINPKYRECETLLKYQGR